MNEFSIGPLAIGGRAIVAPMAGITDRVFRRILVEQGAAFCYTEMVSAKALLYQNKKTHTIMNIEGEEPHCGVQLFGNEPAEMAQAAKMAVDAGARLVDINMGCPMGKVVNNGEGSALLKDVPRALAIAGAVVETVPVPVTVKLRKGYDDDEYGVDLALRLPEVGIAAIAVHGRSRSQFYSGKADWESIRRVKAGVSIPVIGNGDIFTAADAVRMLKETGCDAVMAARGVLGNPWLMRDLRDALDGRELQAPVSVTVRIEMAIRHLQECCALYGDYMGVRHSRKFLGWYLRGYRGAAVARREVNALKERQQVEEYLRHFLQSQQHEMDWELTAPEV